MENTKENSFVRAIKLNQGLIITILCLIALPFVIALINGQSFSSLLANEPGQAKFYQGLIIEIFILAIYALSYDLLLGITGLLSFGHAMFFGVGAYLTGIMLKNFGWTFGTIAIDLTKDLYAQRITYPDGATTDFPALTGLTEFLVSKSIPYYFNRPQEKFDVFMIAS